jgi:hypothetical protein
MRKLFIDRPRKEKTSYGGVDYTKKRDSNTKLWVPWKNQYIYFKAQKPSATYKYIPFLHESYLESSDGWKENFWDQGCENGPNYATIRDYKKLYEDYLNPYRERMVKIKQLECEYNSWLSGRYRLDSEVKSNCDQLQIDLSNSKDMPASIEDDVNRLRCVHNTKEELEHGTTKLQNWEDYYKNKLKALDVRISELEQDIAYEKEQAVNLKNERTRLGITQRHLDDLYPEAQAVVEELAPQSSVAEEMEDEFGEFIDEDGDGLNDNTDATPKEMRAWYWLAGGVVVLGLVSLIATKTIK